MAFARTRLATRLLPAPPALPLLLITCLACASVTPRPFAPALAEAASLAAAKATALEACSTPTHFTSVHGPFLVRSCRGQDQIMEEDAFVGRMLSFAKDGGPLTTVCRYGDTPPVVQCTGEVFDEIIRECAWQRLCELPTRAAPEDPRR